MMITARFKSCAAAAAVLAACLLLPGNQAKAEASPLSEPQSLPETSISSPAPEKPAAQAQAVFSQSAPVRLTTLAAHTEASPLPAQTSSESDADLDAPQPDESAAEASPDEKDTSAEEENAIDKATRADVEAPDDLVKFGDFIATAYCVTGRTSTGTQTTVGRTLAVNPYVIPYGTEVWLYLEDGTFVGDFIAEDTGSNMMANPNVIDIYMGQDSYNDCILWGAQNVSVYVRAASENEPSQE